MQHEERFRETNLSQAPADVSGSIKTASSSVRLYGWDACVAKGVLTEQEIKINARNSNKGTVVVSQALRLGDIQFSRSINRIRKIQIKAANSNKGSLVVSQAVWLGCIRC